MLYRARFSVTSSHPDTGVQSTTAGSAWFLARGENGAVNRVQDLAWEQARRQGRQFGEVAIQRLDNFGPFILVIAVPTLLVLLGRLLSIWFPLFR